MTSPDPAGKKPSIKETIGQVAADCYSDCAIELNYVKKLAALIKSHPEISSKKLIEKLLGLNANYGITGKQLKELFTIIDVQGVDDLCLAVDFLKEVGVSGIALQTKSKDDGNDMSCLYPVLDLIDALHKYGFADLDAEYLNTIVEGYSASGGNILDRVDSARIAIESLFGICERDGRPIPFESDEPNPGNDLDGSDDGSDDESDDLDYPRDPDDLDDLDDPGDLDGFDGQFDDESDEN